MSVLYSCGLYEYSGEWAYSFGIPAKISPSGCLWMIIPKVMGICIYSPRISPVSKLSVRAERFAKMLIQNYPFHVFDSLAGLGNVQKHGNPVYIKPVDADVNNTVELCYYASRGDLEQVQKLIGFGVSPNAADYDGRTALHLSASEGHFKVVQYLLNKNANPHPIDRWHSTPLHGASHAGHSDIVHLLESYKTD